MTKQEKISKKRKVEVTLHSKKKQAFCKEKMKQGFPRPSRAIIGKKGVLVRDCLGVDNTYYIYALALK